jgi:hypothetical protein
MMSGEMLSSSPTPQPGDILFAQKASSCVKAAGELLHEYSADGIYSLHFSLALVSISVSPHLKIINI